MVPGYNWTNNMSMFGSHAFRSNAIFLEPSFFSQFLAINILLYCMLVVEKKYQKKDLMWLVINVLALLTTFSGTGLIILFVGGGIYTIQGKSKKQLKRILLGVLVVGLTGIIWGPILLSTEWGLDIAKFFFRRLTELTGRQGKHVSGYIRFISGFKVIEGIWNQNIIGALFGGGMGSATRYNSLFQGTIDNSGYFKVAGELGMIGLLIFGNFFRNVWKMDSKNNFRKVIICAMIPMFACHEAFLQNYDWIFILLLNDLTRDEEKKDNGQWKPLQQLLF